MEMCLKWRLVTFLSNNLFKISPVYWESLIMQTKEHVIHPSVNIPVFKVSIIQGVGFT